MQELVTPETLDELDRRVYDLAIQHIPLAEIAVRLGVPVPQADEKLQRLYRRLRVTNRDELRALSESPHVQAQVELDDEYVIGAEGEYIIGGETEAVGSRRFPRRAILTAVGIAGLVGLSGAAALVLSRRDAKAPERASPDDEGSATQPNGILPISLISALEGPFVDSRTWSPGSEIDWKHGIFFMSAEIGIVTGYQFIRPVGGPDPWENYRVLGDGRFITAQSGSGESIFFDRRAPDVGWTWKSSEIELHAAYANNLPPVALFSTRTEEKEELRLHFVRFASAQIETVASASVSFDRRDFVAVAADGDRVAIFDGLAHDPSIQVFHIPSGERLNSVSLVGANPGKEPVIGQRSISWVEGVDPDVQQGAQGFFLAQWETQPNGRGDDPYHNFGWRLNRSGEAISAISPEPARTVYAPNGTWALTEAEWVPDFGAAPSDWPFLEVSHGLVSVPAYRVRSASIRYGGTGRQHRWLADMSGFVAAVRAGGFGEYGYAIVGGGETPIEYLPSPPWRFPQYGNGSGWEFGPAPSPYDGALLSFSGVHIYNRRTEKWASARIAPGPALADIDPWSAGPNESVFALPGPFRDDSPEPLFLSPRLELPPFDDSLDFRVEVDPDGLNLREKPGYDARVLALLRDGDVLTLESVEESNVVAVFRANKETWLHVRSKTGAVGWVNAYWLVWA
ncbi:MAG: SH3 domain-containing protein [Dehalococcoidia bacterium]